MTSWALRADQIPFAVDQSLVDQAIASQCALLRFPAALERQFESETARSRSKALAVGGLIGVIAFDFLLISDRWLLPDVFPLALWVRLGIVTPLELLTTWILFRGPNVFVRETIIGVFGAILPTFAHLFLMLSSASTYRYSQHEAIVLVLMFVTMVQRIRFIFAIPTSIACLAIYIQALRLIPGYAFELQLSASITFFCAVIFSLIVSYSLERELRLNFLLDLRNRFQSHVDSHQDALTGLQNRRALDENLATLAAQGTSFSVILMDVDHFKKFNDTAGHPAGDQCLKSIAQIIEQTISGQDGEAFRYGGEEFLIILSNENFREAYKLAERLRVTIEAAKINHPGLPGRACITASFGVAWGVAATHSGVDEIVLGADAALYAAKRNGRNQVWPPVPSEGRVQSADLKRQA